MERQGDKVTRGHGDRSWTRLHVAGFGTGRLRISWTVLLSLAAILAGGEALLAETPSVGHWPAERVACRPAALRQVKLGGFLGRHVDANNRRSLLAGLESPIPRAVEARAAGRQPRPECRRLATDSDFFKWLEGACYAITYDPSLKELAAAVDRYTAMLVELQEPDGFLGTRVSPAKPFDEDVRHDLYVAGHFFEAAVAHHDATGKRDLLDTAVRLADFYIRALQQDHPYYKLVGRQEHPEIEPALVRLYRSTGEKRLLDFAAAVTDMAKVGPKLTDVHAGGGARHAVRLCYYLTGMAEQYIQTGDERFKQHLPSLWDELASTRMYVTGGIGYNETVPAQPFDLPQNLKDNPHRDIAETCASVALMMFSWRMHGLTGESRAFDVIETILYNHYLGAISQDHLGNFYYNPLRRVGDLSGRTDHGADPVRRRRLPEIHSTACCLPNAWRFFGQLPEYVFSTTKDGVLVNLYTDATLRHELSDGTRLALYVKTQYPHEGQVRLRVDVDRPAQFTLGLRIPRWCSEARVATGPTNEKATPGTYYRLTRPWKPGDEVVLHLAMRPVTLVSRPEVAPNRSQVAFQRGPLIYCLERQDTAGLDLEELVVVLNRPDPQGTAVAELDLQAGHYVLRVPVCPRAKQPDALYFPASGPDLAGLRQATLVPFYYRANRADDTRWITWIPYE